MGKKIKLAIVSDLHCHPALSNFKENDSYLLTDSLRKNAHPIQSLENTLNNKVDLIICPGDFTNKSNKQGLISGWDYVRDIKEILKAKDIIGTIGNHDVDVYGNCSSYSFENAKYIGKKFPVPDEAMRDIFWSKGCAFYEDESVRILVINSCHFHYTKTQAGHGEVDEIMLNYIKEYLEPIDDDKILIALMHHHPIDHSRQDLGEDDKIVNSENLLNILGKYNFDLIIHGHKHDPLLRYHNSTQNSKRLTIFSSGSFSATSNNLYCGARNFFHIIEIEKTNIECFGKIFSWTYFPKQGWEKIYDEKSYPPFSGFGNKMSIENIATSIEQKFSNISYLKWNSIVNDLPMVEYLIPQELHTLHTLLKEKNIYTDTTLDNFPSIAFKI